MSVIDSMNGPVAMVVDDKVISKEIGLCQKRLKGVVQQVFAAIPPPGNEPAEFLCSITYARMKDPAKLPCRHAFDFEEISRWLRGNKSCPLCRDPATTPVKDPALKALITQWEEQERVVSLTHFKEENPALAEQYLKAAHSYVESGEYEKVFQAFNDAFQYTRCSEDYRLVPAFYEHLQEPNKATLSYLYLVSYQLNEGNIAEALQTLKCLKEKDSSLPLEMMILTLEFIKNPQANSDTMMQLAKATKDVEEKIFLYTQVIEHCPDVINAYLPLYCLLKDPEEIRALLLKLADTFDRLKIEPKRAAFYRQGATAPIHTNLTEEIWKDPSNTLAFLPSYPQALKDFLKEECTIWKGKKRSETHIVVPLFPEVSIGGVWEPVTIDSLHKLDRSCGGKGLTDEWVLAPPGSPSAAAKKEFHWAVITKGVIPGTTGLDYDQQTRLLPEGYQVPTIFDAVRAMLLRKRVIAKSCFDMFTHCQEEYRGGNCQMAVGALYENGLLVTNGARYHDLVGLAGWREF